MFVKQAGSSAANSIIEQGLSLKHLRETAGWIRDDLDPLVARDGPQGLDPNDVLTLHSLLLDLQIEPVSIHLLPFSRIFLAVRDICGKATRWPSKIVDEADRLVEYWEDAVGPLESIRTPLYEKGGRLSGICLPTQTEREASARSSKNLQRPDCAQDLLLHFGSQNPHLIDNERAYFHGSMGFTPGKWWINGLFAFRDGIISSTCTDGGIVYTKSGAYALVLKGDDETDAPNPGKFTYRCRFGDRGRFRLTSADFRSRYPVRVLRDHRLASIWAPKTGIRYDGLFKVVGWTIRPCDPEKNDRYTVRFDVHFESAEHSIDWDKIMQIPTAEENDDYKMYKIIHREQREHKRREAQDIFEPAFDVGISDEETRERRITRSMSISEIAGLGAQDFPESDSTSGSDRWEDSKSAMDGSYERTSPPTSSAASRRPAYRPDLLTPLNTGLIRTSSMRNLLQAPLGFTAVEPFASLRRTLKLHRHSLDGSDDAEPSKVIDTRFRPVNWNPGRRHDLRPAMDVSDDDLLKIAPFTDLGGRRSSLDTAVISPKTSLADLVTQLRKRGNRERASSQATIFEHGEECPLMFGNGAEN